MRSATRPTTCRSSTRTATRRPRAELDDARPACCNAEECVGEIVNTQGVGPFEGYYNNDDATAKTTRFGWYWSGDLGYKDDDGYLYFAGRNADWIRVDGENFPAGPIEEALRQRARRRARGGLRRARRPGRRPGDGRPRAAPTARRSTRTRSRAGSTRRTAIGPKWRPRYVRVLRDPPTTGTNKIVKRTLVHQKFRRDRVGGDELLRARARRRRRTGRSRPPTRRRCTRRSCTTGRERFWDL